MSQEGRFRILDPAQWPRREQCSMFREFGFPYFSLTADIDITPYRRALPKGGPFTLGIVHALATAANAVPEFRQRLRGNDVIEFDVVHPSIILLNEQEAFRFCSFPYVSDFHAFVQDAPERMATARAASSLFDFDDQDDFLYMTSLPWVSFTGLMHAAPTQAIDSVPRIAWGKTRNVDGRVLLPLNIQVHHALIDGLHVGRFYAKAEERLSHARDWLA